MVIGSNRQKAICLRHGILPRVLSLLGESNGPEIRREACVVLGSLVKGNIQCSSAVKLANNNFISNRFNRNSGKCSSGRGRLLRAQACRRSVLSFAIIFNAVWFSPQLIMLCYYLVFTVFSTNDEQLIEYGETNVLDIISRQRNNQ